MNWTTWLTPCLTAFAPPIAILILRRRVKFFRRASCLALAVWFLSLLPACSVLSIALLTIVQQGPYTAVLVDVPYAAEINQAATRYGLDPVLLVAVVEVESAFDPSAVSPSGARGLAQIMPATAGDLGLADPFDPAANVDAGARYLSWLLSRYGRLDLALAAYNAGPGRVDSCRCIPAGEATRYVQRVTAAYDRYQVLAMVPAGARISHDNPSPVPFKGVDYVTGCGSPILSPVTGKVRQVGFDGYVGQYGSNNSYIILDDGRGETILLHGRYIAVAGQDVVRGQTIIGYEASIGNSTGCHTDISYRRTSSR